MLQQYLSGLEVAVVSNEEIVERIQNGIDVAENQEKLWEQNRSFIAFCIKKYIGECLNQDFNDFLNEGFIGLITAAMKYEAGSETKFLTYASFYIRAALYRYNGLNTYTVRVPEYLKERMRKLIAFRKEFFEKSYRQPTNDEIQESLGISSKSLCHIEKTLMAMKTKSLDEYVSGDTDLTISDLISSDDRVDELAEGGVYHKELHEALEGALSILDKRTELMVKSVFYQGNSYKYTGDVFGCSKQAVYERINKGFYKILRSKHCEVLESFMWEGFKMNPNRLSDYIDPEEVENLDCDFLI